ncbi:hypothetical protein EDD21DRAFT_197614 [Dissophora ornata]|nr:hypothetical protein EDD21DRAFT_197614 [Dissophora ornata]
MDSAAINSSYLVAWIFPTQVPVPASPVVSPSMGPSPASSAHNTFNFLNSDPTLSRSTSRRRPAPPTQLQPNQIATQSALSPQVMASPVSPGRRYPNHRWDNALPSLNTDPQAQAGPEYEHGQGQDQHEDGDYEDEGINDDTDGDGLSGTEDQAERRRRRERSRDRAGADGGPFTPTRSAPQPPNGGAAIPKTREAEIAHIMYIQQQQALFLQEKAMNPPLKTKGSNGNLSGGNSDGSKPRRKLSRHRKQISVISEPKLVSSTNQVKTVPIVRPADQSDNEDAGTKSEYTSGGEGIKKTVRKMRRAVRHAANGVFNDDDSDREEAQGSKSDAEKKGGLKQLKALKSKLAKKLNRPSHGGASPRQDEQAGANENRENDGGRGPVQFFSEDNLRSRYLAQEQEGGNSFAAMGASLRRSNTTRDGGSTSGFHRRGDQDDGDKQEYESGDEEKTSKDGEPISPEQEDDEDTAAKARMAKFGSRTFDKDEMMEVKDGTGESFFLPRWDFDPRADELGSSKSVISVQSSKKLERSASSSTITSTKMAKPATSMAERMQGSAVVEEETTESAESATKPEADGTTESAQPKESSTELTVDDKESAIAEDDNESGSKKLTWGESILGSLSSGTQADQDAPEAEAPGHASDASAAASASSSSGLNSRASMVSEASSNVSSVGGIVVAQVLTRQSSMRRNFKRNGSEDQKVEEEHNQVSNESKTEPKSPASGENSSPLGLGILLPSPETDTFQGPLDETRQQEPQAEEKQLPPLPQEVRPESTPSDPKSLGSVTVRPLSPIRRATGSLGRSPSMASVSSFMPGPSTPPASTNTLIGSPLEGHELAAAKAGVERELSIKKDGLRKLSLGAFTLPQAPTSPLPSPALPATFPVAPIPAVLARQGSHLTERGSVRSTYADSIYDCYDYDSGSEYENQAGGNGSSLSLPISRQGSLNSSRVPDLDSKTTVAGLSTVDEIEGPSTGEANITTATAVLTLGEASTVALSLSSELGKDKEVIATETSAPEMEAPVIRLRGAAKKDDSVDYKEEEHHIHYEDLPAAVAYRMSMMTTVPVDPVGVAASLSSTFSSTLSIPSRPPRHPMRQSRHGSINTLSIGGSSDLTSDSWASNSVRNTRDDLSGWGDADDDLESRDGRDIAPLRREDSAASSGSRQSRGGRSERTMSMMTDKSRLSNAQSEDGMLRRRGSEASSSSVRFPRNENSALTPAEVIRKQWHSERKRETWGSIQSSSSDDATSSSSSRSSHFYFNGRSPSPSPTEEAF